MTQVDHGHSGRRDDRRTTYTGAASHEPSRDYRLRNEGRIASGLSQYIDPDDDRSLAWRIAIAVLALTVVGVLWYSFLSHFPHQAAAPAPDRPAATAPARP
jgi:hypothetical protein